MTILRATLTQGKTPTVPRNNEDQDRTVFVSSVDSNSHLHMPAYQERGWHYTAMPASWKHSLFKSNPGTGTSNKQTHTAGVQ
jgi:hypothetical protein